MGHRTLLAVERLDDAYLLYRRPTIDSRWQRFAGPVSIDDLPTHVDWLLDECLCIVPISGPVLTFFVVPLRIVPGVPDCAVSSPPGALVGVSDHPAVLRTWITAARAFAGILAADESIQTARIQRGLRVACQSWSDHCIVITET